MRASQCAHSSDVWSSQYCMRVSLFVVALSLLSGAILSSLLTPEAAQPMLNPWMPPYH